MIISGRKISAALQESGLIPSKCSKAAIVMKPGHAIQIHYQVFVDEADLLKIAAAFAGAAAVPKGDGE